MDKQLLEFWGQIFLAAAKNQKIFEDVMSSFAPEGHSDRQQSPDMEQWLKIWTDGCRAWQSFLSSMYGVDPYAREDSRTDRLFRRLDKNGDGVITRGEAPGETSFRRADVDGDGRVTRAELSGRSRGSLPRRPPGRVDGELPEQSSQPGTDFELVYVHNGRIAQASVILNAFDQDSADLLIASKRRVHLVLNDNGNFTHAATFSTDNANGWGLHDVNGDGRLDAFVAQQEKGQADGWLNEGGGKFTPTDLGNETLGNTRNVLFADFDGDGVIDSYHSVSSFGANHAGCQLHPGMAGGRFGADIIRKVLDPPVPRFWYATAHHPERGEEEWSNKMFKGAVVRDFDNDGKPDLVTGAYADLGFQEGGRGGVGQRWVEQQDRGLFILHNRSTPGRIRFTEVAREAVGDWAHGNTRSHWNVYAVVPIDYDRDGDFDLFAAAVVRGGSRRRPAEDTRSVAFLENVSRPGRIRFVDRTKQAGFDRFNALPPNERRHISFASGAPIDVDNDGWVDLCLVNRRDTFKTPWPWPHLFRNTGKGTFVEVDHRAHGIGGGGGGRDLNYGDLDSDGRLDVVIHDGTGGGYDGADNTRLYANRIVNDNHWMKIRVTGPDNRFGIGSKVTVLKSETKEILGSDEVRTDFCYRSKRSPVLHFGLGTADTVDVLVRTRDGRVTRTNDLPGDALHRLAVEGARP